MILRFWVHHVVLLTQDADYANLFPLNQSEKCEKQIIKLILCVLIYVKICFFFFGFCLCFFLLRLSSSSSSVSFSYTFSSRIYQTFRPFSRVAHCIQYEFISLFQLHKKKHKNTKIA